MTVDYTIGLIAAFLLVWMVTAVLLADAGQFFKRRSGSIDSEIEACEREKSEVIKEIGKALRQTDELSGEIDVLIDKTVLDNSEEQESNSRAADDEPEPQTGSDETTSSTDSADRISFAPPGDEPAKM